MCILKLKLNLNIEILNKLYSPMGEVSKIPSWSPHAYPKT